MTVTRNDGAVLHPLVFLSSVFKRTLSLFGGVCYIRSVGRVKEPPLTPPKEGEKKKRKYLE
jgi:hypothetical protein